jgi:reactive intermediate/imine deaminase
MEKTVINTPKVAAPAGAYSHALKVGNLLFISGQVGQDSEGNLVSKGDMAAQTRHAMKNITALLEAAGATWENVIKINNYITDMSQLGALGQVRREFIKEPFPTSTSVEVKSLARPDFLIEIEAIAVL